MFVQVMDAINALLSLIKYPPLSLDPFDPLPPNEMRSMIRSWSRIPEDVVHRIVDETYQRAVGPHIDMLRRYEAFSSEVYGELMPAFVTDLVEATGLTEESLFLDLGSGVGNVVLQASLETGCTSYGIEIMPGPAQIARSQLEEFKTRCRMWGVRAGNVELEEGDMLRSAKVDELVKTADVVLVNNKVFLEPREHSYLFVSIWWTVVDLLADTVGVAVHSERGPEAEVPGPEGGRDRCLAQVPHGFRQGCRT